MPEPKKQVEIQLGHMCNNRCVFCVSGQETALGRARPLPTQPILDRIAQAFAEGHRKITLLGGEPTLQPGFMDVVKHAVALGFEEIVLFTNGAKTARASLVDEIRATGGKFTWRISIQGATEEAHERTTRKDGSFARILRTMKTLKDRGETLTINMCVVGSNYESVDRFPELAMRYGAKQLHLDMVRPLDAGERTEAEFAEMIPRYSDMVPALTRMAEGFPESFDLNIGNLPYCIAPHLAKRIDHDGESTETIAVDGDRTLSRPWDKYFVKRRDKSKPDSCRACAFDAKCSGVFEKYRELHGTDELVPVTIERLRALDHDGAIRREIGLVDEALSRGVALRLARLSRSRPFGALAWEATRYLDGGHRAEIELRAPDGASVVVWLADEGDRATGGYRLAEGTAPTPTVVEGLRAVMDALRPVPAPATATARTA